MQIKRRRPFKRPEIEEKKYTRINEKIWAPEIFVIDENGISLGKMKVPEALTRARAVDLDLVEVNPKALPPVCKIMDFGKYKYEQEKMAHKQKVASKKTELKCIRLTFKIKGGDLEIRINQAKKFLEDRNQVKVEMILRGREKAHAQLATETINDFVKQMGEVKTIQALQRQGGKFSIIVGPIN
jgi:translation initiation factor IF-3